MDAKAECLRKLQEIAEINLNDPWKRLYLILSLRILDRENQA